MANVRYFDKETFKWLNAEQYKVLTSNMTDLEITARFRTYIVASSSEGDTIPVYKMNNMKGSNSFML